MSDLKPILGLSSTIIKKLDPIIKNLPNDPKEIAVVAQSNGDNVQRLACCLKLLRMFYSSIPKFRISGKESICIDHKNPRFEDELTISKRSGHNSITTLFTCCMISVGSGAIKHFVNSPSSPNPFSQCLRLLFRLTWFLRVRKSLLTELHAQNRMGILNNSIRLSSFRDLCPSAMRSAIFTACSNPDKVNLRLFAYSVPKRYLTDSVRKMYDEFKELLSKERQEELFDLEVSVDQIIKSKLNPTFFSARTALEDTILYTFPLEELYEDPYDDLMSGYLYEICPDNELEVFRKDFINAAKKASSIKLEGVKKKFDLVHIVNVDVPPKGYVKPEQKVEEESIITQKKKNTDFNMFDMFKTKHNFIDETRNLYKTK